MIAFSLIVVSLKGRLTRLSMSSPYRRLAAHLSARKARLTSAVRSSLARLTADVKSALMLPIAGARSFLARLRAVRLRPRFPRHRGRPGEPRPADQVPAAVRAPVERKPKPPRILPASRRQLRPRSFLGRRIDAFLMIATLMILVLVTSGYFRRILTDAPAPVSIFVSPQYWAIFGETADALIQEFEGQNPGFRIAMAGPEDLDVVFFDDGEYAVLVDSAALASLSPYIYTETDEDQWSLPLVSFVDLFFYNIDLLREAGNDRPPGTRAEFLAAARSVAEMAADGQEGIFPFAMGLDKADPLGVRRDFHPWVWALGAEIHSGLAADGTPALTAPATATINFLAQMYRDGLIAPGTFETTGRERLEQFAAGRIAMMVASARDVLLVRNSAGGVNFDITAIPATAMGRNRLGMTGIYAGISSTSQRPNEAWGFLVFVAARSHLLASALGAVPGSFFINFPSRYIEEDPLYAKAWEIFEAADIVEFPSGDISEKEAGLVIREMLARAFEAD